MKPLMEQSSSQNFEKKKYKDQQVLHFCNLLHLGIGIVVSRVASGLLVRTPDQGSIGDRALVEFGIASYFLRM